MSEAIVRPGFTCWLDKQGDLFVQDGTVLQARTGVVILVGSGGDFSETSINRSNDELVPATQALGATLVGGSGRNLHATGLPPRTSGAPVPTGWWRPTVPGQWTNGTFTLTVNGPSDAKISDGTDVIALLTTGGTAPMGDYDSTTYGTDTYGEIVALVPQPFTLPVTAEEGGILGEIPGAVVEISGGAAEDANQFYVALDATSYEGATDPDWTIAVLGDGSAELRYQGDVMAIREAGLAYDPAGVFTATELGVTEFPPVIEELPDDPDSDPPEDPEEPEDPDEVLPWTATVEVQRRAPRIGKAYIQVVEVDGVVTAVNGPFFATALPANFGETYHVPLATCDGFDVEQHHTGLLYWDTQVTALTRPLRLANYLVAELPDAAAAGAGALAFVMDSTVTLAAGLGDVVAGGGANQVKVHSDGADWLIG